MNKHRFKGKVGEEYDLFRLALPHHDELQATISDKLKEYYSKRDRQHIDALEIGCGTGITTQEILSADPRIRLVAIDNEEVMIKQAKATLSNQTVGFVQSDALTYFRKLPAGCLDTVVSAFTIHNFTDTYRQKLFAEIYRTLKHEGVFINADKIAHDSPEEHKIHLNWQLKKFETFMDINRPELIGIWVDHYIKDEKPGTILKEGTYIDNLRKAGFSDVTKTYREHMDATIVAIK